MRKLLSFIVRLALLLLIVSALGLILPPRFDIRTVVRDNPGSSSNLPMGSVTYAIKADPQSVRVGDRILVQDGRDYSAYVLVDLDVAGGKGTVRSRDDSSKSYQVSFSDYVAKIIVTIPFMGYLKMLTYSQQGLYILGGAVLLLILLAILTRKRD